MRKREVGGFVTVTKELRVVGERITIQVRNTCSCRGGAGSDPG